MASSGGSQVKEHGPNVRPVAGAAGTRGSAARHRVLVRTVVDSGSLKNIQELGGRDG